MERRHDHLRSLFLQRGDGLPDPLPPDMVRCIDAHPKPPLRGIEKRLAVAAGGDPEGFQHLTGLFQSGSAIILAMVVGQGHRLHTARR